MGEVDGGAEGRSGHTARNRVQPFASTNRVCVRPHVISPVTLSSALLGVVHTLLRQAGLVSHDSWVLKVVQLYDTQLVRHGIMVTGPSGAGKSKIFDTLLSALSATSGIQHRMVVLNPKAFRMQDMFGETDLLTGEWAQGVFSALWEKHNSRGNSYTSWIVCDGPVDTLWVESMNTVLDDNKVRLCVLVKNGRRSASR